MAPSGCAEALAGTASSIASSISTSSTAGGPPAAVPPVEGVRPALAEDGGTGALVSARAAVDGWVQASRRGRRSLVQSVTDFAQGLWTDGAQGAAPPGGGRPCPEADPANAGHGDAFSDALAEAEAEPEFAENWERYADCPGPGAPEAGVSPDEEREVAILQSRAQTIGCRLAERAAAVRGGLNEALRRGEAREVGAHGAPPALEAPEPAFPSWHSAEAAETVQPSTAPSPLLRRLKFAPLNAAEMLGSWQDGGCGSAAAEVPPSRVGALAWTFWEQWCRKHAALTAVEGLYASLLVDSRRTQALSAELQAVQAIVRGEGGDSPRRRSPPAAAEDLGEATMDRRQEALAGCWEQMEAIASEAIQAFHERVRHYPCGRTSSVTGQFKIARAASEIEQVKSAFEEKVKEETKEAMTQAMEVAVTPGLRLLIDTLNRRLAFWESEIEESWACWSQQSSDFHEACQGAAESWSQLRAAVESLLTWMEEHRAPQEAAPLLYVMPLLDMKASALQRRWDESHDALVEVATVIALLGAWAAFHSLRGDGQVLHQARGLLASVLESLDARFGPSFTGSDAVRAGLAESPVWRLVVPALEAEAVTPEWQEDPWWSPSSWAPRPRASQAAAAASRPGSGPAGAPLSARERASRRGAAAGRPLGPRSVPSSPRERLGCSSAACGGIPKSDPFLLLPCAVEGLQPPKHGQLVIR